MRTPRFLFGIVPLIFAVCAVMRAQAAIQLITPLHPSAALSESADGPSGLPQISADGRYVLFTSGANNLVDTEFDKLGISIYVHDRVTHTTIDVSSTNGGWLGRGDVTAASLSPDGKTVLFTSTSTNLGFFDRFANSPDIFQNELSSGKITLINRSTTSPTQPATGGAQFASMTPNGRFVVFQSTASDAVQLTSPDTTSFPDVFVRDVMEGETTLVSGRGTATNLVLVANQASTPVAISTNGGFVLYYSLASDLNQPMFTVYTQRLWLRDLTLQTNILISRGASTGDRESAFAASMSDDANVIAFAANARLENANAPSNHTNVFVRVLQADTLKPMALPVALKTNLSSVVTKVSPGGSRVAVTTYARVSNTNQPRLFIYDVATDAMSEIDLGPYGPIPGGSVQTLFVNESTLLLGTVTNSVTNSITVGSEITIRSIPSTLMHASADGSVIAFATEDALVTGDLNNESDVYLLDSAGLELISKAHPRWKRPLPDMSIHHLQSAHSLGDRIAFTSFSDALVAGDTNGFADIFTWSKSSGEVRLETVGLDGAGANGHSSEPALSRDSHWLAFVSAASNLVANDTNHMEDVFLKSLDDGSIVRVTESVRAAPIRLAGVSGPVLGQSDRYVAYTSMRSDLTMTNLAGSTGAYLLDRASGENIYIGVFLSGATQRAVAIYEPLVYFFVTTNLYVYDIGTRERRRIGPSSEPAFSSDGSVVLLQSRSSTAARVDVFHPTLRTVSLGFEAPMRTDPITVSDNGIFSFQSDAAFTRFDTDGTNDVYVFDFARAALPRLATTPSPLPRGSGDLLPRSSVISRDGLRVFYQAPTNSPIDLVPRTRLMVADVTSGATATVIGAEAAPVLLSKPVFVSTGFAANTTARALFDTPVDKAKLFYYADVANADNDGLPDLWEMAVFGSLDQTDSADPDADGMTNRDEMLAETDPFDAASVLALRLVDAGSAYEIWVRDVTPRPIIVQFTEKLEEGFSGEIPIADRIRNGDSFVYPFPKQSETAYFRVLVLQ